MPRPQKRRRICSMPGHCRFGPRGEASSCTIVMTLDEYEAIRLIDLLGCTQEECARQMGVARTTVQAVYDRARKKLAEALVQGKELVISGGEYWADRVLAAKDFKTEGNKPLSAFSDAASLSFSSDGEFCINNLLWL